MPPQAAKKTPLSIDDYLAGERDAETRHEYIDGEVYAMSGASRRHALIVTAMTFAPKSRSMSLCANAPTLP